MEVKEGYKQTEVGVIPEEWDVKRIDELFSITAGGDLKKESFSNIKDEKHLYPIYSNSLTNKGLYGYSSEYKYNRNCITITARGTLGVANPRDQKFNAIIRVLVLSPIKKLDCVFMAEYINNNITFSIESTGVPQLTAPQISKYKIVYPQPEEQSAIATTLSDTDTLITSLEKLIEKKRNIKRGTMQELLTGKRRIPGFEEEKEYKQTELGLIPKDWLILPIQKLVNKFVSGGTPSTIKPEYWTGDIPWITGADIIDQKVIEIRRYITEEAVRNSSTNVIEKGNLLLVSRTGVGKLALAPYNIAISQDFTGIYTNHDLLLAEYLYRYFDYNQSILTKQIQGTSIKGITRGTLSSIQFPLPPKTEEQQAISQIFTDMDSEIEALEKKLAKYRDIKKGMMQNLLTGKTRLV